VVEMEEKKKRGRTVKKKLKSEALGSSGIPASL